MAKKRVVVVEDERDLADLVAMRLAKEGYAAEVIGDGAEALARIHAKRPPDLVLLDIMLPGMQGTEVAAALRSDPATADVPILMLTAKGEDADVVLGLHVGADDYVTKPFSMSVLMARVAALLRRASTGDGSGGADVLTVGEIRIDRGRHRVDVAGEPITLTLTEFRLLTALAATSRGRVLSRAQLMDKALGEDVIVTDRTIDVHITNLRRKLGEAKRHIETVRGLGYRIREHDDEAS